jgi:hypothetical protein
MAKAPPFAAKGKSKAPAPLKGKTKSPFPPAPPPGMEGGTPAMPMGPGFAKGGKVGKRR